MPRRHSVPVELTREDRSELQRMRQGPRRLGIRAEVVLRAAAGETNYYIAKDLRISRNTVRHWRFRFARERVAGLRTRPIPGRPRKVAKPTAGFFERAAVGTQGAD